MNVKQLSIFLENKPGMLAEFARVLQDNDISMRALSLAEAPDFGVLRIIVDDPYKLSSVLKDEGYVYSVTPVLAAVVPDKAGSLVKILDILAENDVNLEYTYTFLGRRPQEAYMILRVSDNDTAIKMLTKAGVKLMCQDDINDMLK